VYGEVRKHLHSADGETLKKNEIKKRGSMQEYNGERKKKKILRKREKRRTKKQAQKKP